MKQKVLIINMVEGKKIFTILQVSYLKEDEHERKGRVERYVKLQVEDIRLPPWYW